MSLNNVTTIIMAAKAYVTVSSWTYIIGSPIAEPSPIMIISSYMLSCPEPLWCIHRITRKTNVVIITVLRITDNKISKSTASEFSIKSKGNEEEKEGSDDDSDVIFNYTRT